MRKSKRKVYPPDDRILVVAEDPDSLPDLCDGGLSAGAIAAIGAGISAAGSVGTAAINAGARWGSSTYMRVAKEMARFNNNIAIANWQRENEYNSPAAQMQRYRDAGLNPNLIYGQQNTGGTIQSGQASTNPGDYRDNNHPWANALSELGSAVSMYQDLRTKAAQADLATMSAAAQQQRAALDAAKTESIEIKNAFDSAANNSNLEHLNMRNAQDAIQLEIDTQYKAQSAQIKLQQEIEKLENLKKRNASEDQNLENLKQMYKIYGQQIVESQARVRQINQSMAIAKGQYEFDKYWKGQLNQQSFDSNALKYQKDAAELKEWEDTADIRLAANNRKRSGYGIARKTEGYTPWAKFTTGMADVWNGITELIPFRGVLK